MSTHSCAILKSEGLMKSDPLHKWVKKYPVGGCLFAQNDAGSTVYLIKSGRVQLFRRNQEQQKIVGTVGAGHILGERALLNQEPYQHSFTAKIMEPTEVIQFEPSELPVVEARLPEFKMRLLATVSARLEKANEFIRILQTKDLSEQILRYILYFVKFNQGAAGEETQLLTTEIEGSLQLEVGTAEPVLQTLVEQKALKCVEGKFFVTSRDLLEHRVKKLTPH